MRSLSSLSAVLCSILWVSLNVGNVVAEKGGGSDLVNCDLYQIGICRDACIQNNGIPPTCVVAQLSTTSVALPTSTSAIFGSTPTSVSSSAVTSMNVNIVVPTTATSPTATPAATTGLENSENSDNSPPKGTVSPAVQVTSVSSSKKSKNNTGPIIGGVIGGIIILGLIFGVAFFLWRRRQRGASSTHDFGALEKSRASSSPSVYPAAGVSTYDSPSPAPQLSPAPAITPVESHHLMGGYSEPGQQPHGEIVPVVGATKPYAVNSQREVDADGVSLRSPSPVQDGERRSGERDSVPRLPIYNRGGGTNDRGPAL